MGEDAPLRKFVRVQLFFKFNYFLKFKYAVQFDDG
jgi:hypothetical protein